MNALIDIELDLMRSNKKVLVSVEDLDTILSFSKLWRIDSNGYAMKGTKYLHHLVMPIKEGFIIDHINREKLDCTRRNLRYATWHIQNTNRIQYNSSSKVRGVSFNRSNLKYQVTKKLNGKLLYFGYYSNKKVAEEKAIEIYKENGWQIN